jgi:hypothetical protein
MPQCKNDKPRLDREFFALLKVTPRDVTCKTQGQDGVAVSFPVGLFHPLQHAGLSRRSPVCRPLVPNRRIILSTGESSDREV